jgi:hypothetical protein
MATSYDNIKIDRGKFYETTHNNSQPVITTLYGAKSNYEH